MGLLAHKGGGRARRFRLSYRDVQKLLFERGIDGG
jgi:hypothetical protein